MTRFLIAAAITMVCTATYAQKKTSKPAVLFTVGKEKTSADEFIYLYKKNHLAKEEYTDQKIEEYLDLFINFKLKVTEARARKLDATPEFIKEYNTYKDELKKPYLPEGKILDSLVKLTYTRLQTEVSAAHILIEVKQDAAPADTLQAYNTAVSIKNQLLAGEDFATKAALYSDEPNAKTSGGNLGYFTSLQMVAPFEDAVYAGNPGDIVGPVRTSFGYHIIKVGEKRPGRGEVEVSHIMLRSGARDEGKAKALISEIHKQLVNGAKWEDLVKQYSEDPGSKDHGGKLRPFGVSSRIPAEFDSVAFSLKTPGEISAPFQTAYGWHIVRLERKIPLPSFEESAASLKNRIARDPRVQISKQALLKKLKKDFTFTENAPVKTKVLSLADTALTKGKWKIPGTFSSGKEVLFTVENKKTTAHDFLSYVQQNQRANSMAPEKYMELLYTAYTEVAINEAFERKLIATNPEFDMLLVEYYEGILLFDIMEKEVWKKASEDSVGQHNFFDAHPELYKAGERVNATIYYSDSKSNLELLSKSLQANDSVQTHDILKNRTVYHETGIFQREDRPALRDIDWKPGYYFSSQNGTTYHLVVVGNMIPAGALSFEDARASVISEYQNELEKNWLAELRKKYPVKVNSKTKQYVVEKLKS